MDRLEWRGLRESVSEGMAGAPADGLSIGEGSSSDEEAMALSL